MSLFSSSPPNWMSICLTFTTRGVRDDDGEKRWVEGLRWHQRKTFSLLFSPLTCNWFFDERCVIQINYANKRAGISSNQENCKRDVFFTPTKLNCISSLSSHQFDFPPVLGCLFRFPFKISHWIQNKWGLNVNVYETFEAKGCLLENRWDSSSLHFCSFTVSINGRSACFMFPSLETVCEISFLVPSAVDDIPSSRWCISFDWLNTISRIQDVRKEREEEMTKMMRRRNLWVSIFTLYRPPWDVITAAS